jgi:hypothetical protein
VLNFGLLGQLKERREWVVGVWEHVAFGMLDSIRVGVQSHLPDLHVLDIAAERFIKPRMPELPNVAFVHQIRPQLPDFNFMDVSARLDDACARFSDLDFQSLPGIPILSDHLHSLYTYVSSLKLSSGTIHIQSLLSLKSYGV